MAYKIFTNGSVLNASEVNENLMQQAVATFSNAAARTAAITSPVEGQLTYLLDTDRIEWWSGSSWRSPFGATHVVTQTVAPGTTSLSLNNVFTSEFRNYKIIFNLTTTSAFSMSARLRVSGVDATSNYDRQLLIANNTSITANRAVADSSFRVAGVDSTRQSLELLICEPAVAERTTGFVRSLYYTPMEFEQTAFRHTTASAYDGITFFGGTFSGVISVYGWRS